MAIFLAGGWDPSYWNKFGLDFVDTADYQCIKDGEAWLGAQRSASLAETMDFRYVGFKSAERPWRAEFLPTRLKMTKGRKLPSLISKFPGDGVITAKPFLVHPDLKDLICSFGSEADGWQFFPVEIYRKDMTLYGTYYIWWVHAVCDAVDETSEAITTVAGDVDGSHLWTTASGPKQTRETMRVHKAAFEGRSAWIDWRFNPHTGIFVTQALFDAMVAGGFNGFEAAWEFAEV